MNRSRLVTPWKLNGSLSRVIRDGNCSLTSLLYKNVSLEKQIFSPANIVYYKVGIFPHSTVFPSSDRAFKGF